MEGTSCPASASLPRLPLFPISHCSPICPQFPPSVPVPPPPSAPDPPHSCPRSAPGLPPVCPPSAPALPSLPVPSPASQHICPPPCCPVTRWLTFISSLILPLSLRLEPMSWGQQGCQSPQTCSPPSAPFVAPPRAQAKRWSPMCPLIGPHRPSAAGPSPCLYPNLGSFPLGPPACPFPAQLPSLEASEQAWIQPTAGSEGL